MGQVQKKINVSKAISVILDWISTDPYIAWAETPQWIMNRLSEGMDEDGNITYNKASQILIKAESHKLHKAARNGFGYFRQEWRRNYIN